MLRQDDKVKPISRIPLFIGSPGAERARIGAITVQAEVLRGKRRMDSLGPGDFVGGMALLTDAPRIATVRATSPVIVLRATRKVFAALLETSPGRQRTVRKASADRLAHATG
jgi:CRP-like cAMP-binding protein